MKFKWQLKEANQVRSSFCIGLKKAENSFVMRRVLCISADGNVRIAMHWS